MAAFVIDGASVVCSGRNKSPPRGGDQSDGGRRRGAHEQLEVNQQTVTGNPGGSRSRILNRRVGRHPRHQPQGDLPLYTDGTAGNARSGRGLLCPRLLKHELAGTGVARPVRRFGIEGSHGTLALELKGTDVASMMFRPAPRRSVHRVARGNGDDVEQLRARCQRHGRAGVRLVADGEQNGGQYIAATNGELYAEYERLDVSN